MNFSPWLFSEFANKCAPGGVPAARFASYIEVRDQFLAWEAQHPGVSSSNYPAEITDYTLCEGLTLITPKGRLLAGSRGVCTSKCGNGVCDRTWKPRITARGTVNLQKVFRAG